MIRLSLALILVGRGADIATTMLGLSRGAAEGNPAMAWAMLAIGPLQALLVGAVALVVITTALFYSAAKTGGTLGRLYRYAALSVSVLVLALGFLMAGHNLTVIGVL